MNARIRTEDAATELLTGYLSNVRALHGKLAKIADQQRDIIAAVRRMSAALRRIDQRGQH